MTRPTVLLLNGAEAELLLPTDVLLTMPFADGADSADALAAAVDDAHANGGSALRDLVLVVGGAWLECATITLPPLPTADQRRALQFQAARHFPFTGDVASTLVPPLAVACDAAWLGGVALAFASARSLTVLALPVAAAACGLSGAWHSAATRTSVQHLTFTVSGGVLQEVRRQRGAAAASARALDTAALLRAVQQRGVAAWSLAAQLLDTPMELAHLASQRRAWWRAGALVAAAALFAIWATGQSRERLLVATQSEMAAAERDAAPALAALERLRRTAHERDALRASAAAAQRADAPSHVLARLGTLLPTSAFVQHLEWDGTRWRIDGSATDAAALIPRLDADAEIDAVRMLAPSTRFLDGTTPRSSFSIGFAMRGAPPAGRSNGAP